MLCAEFFNSAQPGLAALVACHGLPRHQRRDGAAHAAIAVLPFSNMSGNPKEDYFAEGMADEIITALSRYAWLFVIDILLRGFVAFAEKYGRR